MFAQLMTMMRRPALYEKGAELWTDDHISKGMLEAHLNPDWDAATRKHSAVPKIVNWINSIAPAEKYHDLLDLGCGPGIYTEEFHKSGYKVSGVDFSERSINYARNSAQEKNLPITYYHRNYLTLGFTAKFDIITLIYYDFGVLSTEDRAKLLRKTYTALRPGGLMILDVLTPNHYVDRNKEYKHWEYAERSFFCAEPHIHLESFFMYEKQNTFCEQHIVVTANTVKCINIWEHTFIKDELEQNLKDTGFTVYALYGSISGAEYSDNGSEMCIIAQKGGE